MLENKAGMDQANQLREYSRSQDKRHEEMQSEIDETKKENLELHLLVNEAEEARMEKARAISQLAQAQEEIESLQADTDYVKGT